MCVIAFLGAVGFAEFLAVFLRHGLKLPRERALDEKLDLLLPFSIGFLGLGLDLGGLRAVGIGVERDAPAIGNAPALGVKARLEDGAELVVILLRNGVVTVIVALRAANGHAHKGGGNNLDRLGHHLIAGVVVVGGGGAVGRHAQETSGGELVDLPGLQFLVRRLHHLVAGELFADELIPRQILVKGVHDIIAITPRPCALGVAFVVAFGIRIAGDVQPMPAPAHAVLWRAEQAINELRVGVGRFVFHKFFDLLRRGRQTGEVERGAANQRTLVGRFRKLQPFRVQPPQQKRIHRIGRTLGHFRVLDRLKRPEAAFLVGDAHRIGILRLGPCCLGALRDPIADQPNLLRRQLGLFLRHLARVDHLEQPAFLRLAFHHRRPVLAALEDQPRQPHIQFTALPAILAVAMKTMRLQDRPNVLFKQNRSSRQLNGERQRKNRVKNPHTFPSIDPSRRGEIRQFQMRVNYKGNFDTDLNWTDRMNKRKFVKTQAEAMSHNIPVRRAFSPGGTIENSPALQCWERRRRGRESRRDD